MVIEPACRQAGALMDSRPDGNTYWPIRVDQIEKQLCVTGIFIAALQEQIYRRQISRSNAYSGILNNTRKFYRLAGLSVVDVFIVTPGTTYIRKGATAFVTPL